MWSLEHPSPSRGVKERLRLLYSREQITERVKMLAGTINQDYSGRQEIILIGILKGAFVFLADLIRHLTVPVIIDFIQLSSYGAYTQSSGQVMKLSDLHHPIREKDVIVVEDILDSGLTMRFLLEELQKQHPRSLKICALIDKRHRRLMPIEADYVGFHLEEGFVVGYGIDYNEKYRQLPDIYTVEFLSPQS
ncbi:MAG: hypoxanthine phosphoribosyltransferase [Nitrospinota bacterium]|nr:MAG: hypoxanthine phosphoribosyltransferase [Nitrospinota bacterium]